MYFCYQKQFDISRARINGAPRISGVSLSSFGPYSVSREPIDERHGYINCESLEEGLKDFLNYGFEELRKVEFVDLADGELDNFHRMIAVDIQNISTEFLRGSDDSGAQAVINRLCLAIQGLEAKLGITSGTAMIAHAPFSIATLRDAITSIITSNASALRKLPSTGFSSPVNFDLQRPMVGEHVLPSSEGFEHCVIRSMRHGPTLESLLIDSDTVSMNGFVLALDDSPLTSRYVRFIQYLAHKYSKYRIQVRRDERNRTLNVYPMVEQDYTIESAFERFRPHIPCEVPENMPLEDKLVMCFMVMSRINLAAKWNIGITDEDFHNYDREAILTRMGRLGQELNITPVNVGDLFANIMPHLVEVIWSLGKLKWTHLQSTSLNFPELETFTQTA